ncbi:blue copper protein 1b-like [Humulus lupulus]|uniref:blue copper protein 1b-like n=1 Tax=Humulus lupulus TaxID=3486 RepID=UPI002B410F0E|nr:blue copper protein 1b-like [Humulus lupulus]
MASSSSYQLIFITLAIIIIAILVPSISAVEYVVGDETGWTTNFDYQAWALGKEFHVGDKLVFKYPEGDHNVFKVDGAGFKQCAPPANTAALTSGNDVITLTTPGRKWYICGVSQHCQVGNQKLLITVLGDDQVASPTPTPTPTSSPSPTQEDQPSTANLNSFSRLLGFVTTFLLITGLLGVFFA